jgi:hypothetical protein
MLMTVLEVSAFITGLSTLLMVLDQLEPPAEPGEPSQVRPPVAHHRCAGTHRPLPRRGVENHGSRPHGCSYSNRIATVQNRQNSPWRRSGTHSMV